MTEPHVIRVEDAHVDPLRVRAEGTLVRREADGAVTRQPLSVPGDPTWTSGEAEAALLREGEADERLDRRGPLP